MKAKNATGKNSLIASGITLLIILIIMVWGYNLPEPEPVETISVEEAIETGVYELQDSDFVFRREINYILEELNLDDINFLTFTRVSDWKDGRRYMFEIDDSGGQEPITVYTKNGNVVTIRSRYGAIFDIN